MNPAIHKAEKVYSYLVEYCEYTWRAPRLEVSNDVDYPAVFVVLIAVNIWQHASFFRALLRMGSDLAAILRGNLSASRTRPLIGFCQICGIYILWRLHSIECYRPYVAIHLVMTLFTRHKSTDLVVYRLIMFNIPLAVFVNKIFVADNQNLLCLFFITNVIDYVNAWILFCFSSQCSTNSDYFLRAMVGVHYAWILAFHAIDGSRIDLATLLAQKSYMSDLIDVHRASCVQVCGYPLRSCDQGRYSEIQLGVAVECSRLLLLSIVEPRWLRVGIWIVWHYEVQNVSIQLVNFVKLEGRQQREREGAKAKATTPSVELPD